jgi:hypothetical protein
VYALLDLPVLQIYCILSAIRERKKSFVFTDGSSVSLDPRVGFFITMVSLVGLHSCTRSICCQTDNATQLQAHCIMTDFTWQICHASC